MNNTHNTAWIHNNTLPPPIILHRLHYHQATVTSLHWAINALISSQYQLLIRHGSSLRLPHDWITNGKSITTASQIIHRYCLISFIDFHYFFFSFHILIISYSLLHWYFLIHYYIFLLSQLFSLFIIVFQFSDIITSLLLFFIFFFFFHTLHCLRFHYFRWYFFAIIAYHFHSFSFVSSFLLIFHIIAFILLFIFLFSYLLHIFIIIFFFIFIDFIINISSSPLFSSSAFISIFFVAAAFSFSSLIRHWYCFIFLSFRFISFRFRHIIFFLRFSLITFSWLSLLFSLFIRHNTDITLLPLALLLSWPW